MAVTSWELLQIDTHFLNNRTLPCVQEHCPGCARERPRRYEAYISGIWSTERRHIILAMTEGAARNIFDQAPNANQLRGHIITFKRNGHRTNGRLDATVSENMVSANTLPEAPELLRHLAHIWGLDLSHIAQDHPEYAQAVQKMYSRGATQPDAQPRP
jgi:hypothetical protein